MGLNDLGNFQDVHETIYIYPNEFVLSCTTSLGIQANYLDLRL